jgi:TniQ
MWGTWPREPPAWPVAPRPFTVEPIGGWLGRVAARYRMSVDELAQQYGLELDFNRTGNAWLLVGRIGGATIERLARLARVDPAILKAMQGLPAGHVQLPQLVYCPSCLFLNPLDVTSPCWKQEWLAPSAAGCAMHVQPLTRLSITSLRSCDNFDQLLRVISRRERQRRAQCS